MVSDIKKQNVRFAILLSALLMAVVFMVWSKEPGPKSDTERCIAIDNQLKMGVGLSYEDHKYRAEHCTRYDH